MAFYRGSLLQSFVVLGRCYGSIRFKQTPIFTLKLMKTTYENPDRTQRMKNRTKLYNHTPLNTFIKQLKTLLHAWSISCQSSGGCTNMCFVYKHYILTI